MFILQAPYPSLETTSYFPNPEFGDSENIAAEVLVKRMMDGTVFTYVHRKDNRHRFLWSFRLTRTKALELRAFIYSYYASQIRVTDHTDRVWVGHLINNPFEFDTVSRAAPAIAPMPRGETQMIELEFEGIEV